MAIEKYLGVEDIIAHKLASKVAEIVWNEVQAWPWIAKKTVGVQWIESTDSISANIAEGFGRFHKKDKVKFYYNAKGSLLESIDWTKKALKRMLISESKAKEILEILERLPREIHFQIRYTMENLEK